MLSIYLKAGRDRPVLNGHPWVFSGAVERVEGDGKSPELVDVYDHKKTWLARGFYNPKSQIRARLLTWRKEEIDRGFFSRRLSCALTFRRAHLPSSTTAYRIINGEGDFLPGLIIDRYGGFLVCQIFSAGMKSISAGKVQAALSPRLAKPIMAMQPPSKIFRRLARSAKNPEGKLAIPAKSVRAEASAPACAKLNPKELVMIGSTTTTTPLKRCSVMWALQFAASLPQPINGLIRV